MSSTNTWGRGERAGQGQSPRGGGGPQGLLSQGRWGHVPLDGTGHKHGARVSRDSVGDFLFLICKMGAIPPTPESPWGHRKEKRTNTAPHSKSLMHATHTHTRVRFCVHVCEHRHNRVQKGGHP